MQGDGNSYWPDLTRDGKALAFVSEATNLVAGDDNAHSDAFVLRLRP